MREAFKMFQVHGEIQIDNFEKIKLDKKPLLW